MKNLVLRLIELIVQAFNRFRSAAPANQFEALIFLSIRSAIARAVFPPGVVSNAGR